MCNLTSLNYWKIVRWFYSLSAEVWSYFENRILDLKERTSTDWTIFNLCLILHWLFCLTWVVSITYLGRLVGSYDHFQQSKVKSENCSFLQFKMFQLAWRLHPIDKKGFFSFFPNWPIFQWLFAQKKRDSNLQLHVRECTDHSANISYKSLAKAWS